VKWSLLARQAMESRPPTMEQAIQMLGLSDEATLSLVEAAWEIRRSAFGRTVRGHVLVSASRGGCAEDCAYCAQSAAADSSIEPHRFLPADAIVAQARIAKVAGASRLCIVAAGRSPRPDQMATLVKALGHIKREVGLEVCASLGLIDGETAAALKRAGLDAYNHNLNTSRERYPEICTSHRYEDRLATIAAAAEAGLAVCSGVIVGMGESNRELVEMAFTLRRLTVSSIPVNFLLPVPGTPLGSGRTVHTLTAWRCLRILSMFRFVNPFADLRASAGRERHLRSLQPLAFLVANSLFLGDYLTQPGQSVDADRRVMADLGLVLETEHAAGLHLAAADGVGH